MANTVELLNVSGEHSNTDGKYNTLPKIGIKAKRNVPDDEYFFGLHPLTLYHVFVVNMKYATGLFCLAVIVANVECASISEEAKHTNRTVSLQL